MRKYCIPYHCYWPFIWIPILLLLLQLVHGEQQPQDQKIQRRFMWQQMDNSVMGGFMGRMFGGARVMKSMFGDLLPSTSGYAKTMMDFLPTETTRVKYIIRDPHTNKPMKIIKMRGTPKKVVKLMRTLPKPTVTEPSQLQYENRIRQLEKEQELIVEGKVPMSSDEALMDKYFKQKARPNSNEIVSGKIMEYQSWKPMYKPGEKPSTFVTLRPQPLTQLHTNIAAGNHELLPKPEKLVGNRPELEEEDDDFEQVEDDSDNDNELSKPTHQYEVTEHTGEASGEVHSVASMESGFVPSKHIYSMAGSSISSSNSNNHAPRPRPRSSATSTTTTTSTTEAPNYPAAFLKKYHEREAEVSRKPNGKPKSKHHKDHTRHHSPIEIREPVSNVSFAMSSLRARLQEQQKQNQHDEEMEAALMDAMNGDKWPAEVHQTGSYLTSPIGPSAVAFDQPLKLPRTEYKRQRSNVRQRGSVKFTDNPGFEEV